MQSEGFFEVSKSMSILQVSQQKSANALQTHIDIQQNKKIKSLTKM